MQPSRIEVRAALGRTASGKHDAGGDRAGAPSDRRPSSRRCSSRWSGSSRSAGGRPAWAIVSATCPTPTPTRARRSGARRRSGRRSTTSARSTCSTRPSAARHCVRRAAADALRESHRLPFAYRDVVLTPGAMAALQLALRVRGTPRRRGRDSRALLARLSALRPLRGHGPRLVPLRRGDFDSISMRSRPRCRSVPARCVLSPSGQSDRAELRPRGPRRSSAAPCDSAEERLGCRGHADRRRDPPRLHCAGGELSTAPSGHYERTMIVYSFGKYHFIQGQRLGYAAVSPSHPERDAVASELVRWTRITGIATPTALMQRALPALLEPAPGPRLGSSAGETAVQTELREAGYEVAEADGNPVRVRPHPERPRRLRVRGGARDPRRARPPGAGLPPRRLVPPLPHRLRANVARCASNSPGSLRRREHDPSARRTRPHASPGTGRACSAKRTFVRARSPHAGCGAPRPPWSRPPAPGRRRIVRDPLGIGKLFWAADRDGLVFSARPWRLGEEGHPLEDIRAVPRGASHRSRRRASPQEHPLLSDGWPAPDENASPAAIGASIRRKLDAYLSALAGAQPSARVIVCLSGGLDSSGIAVLVRRALPRGGARQLRPAPRGGAERGPDHRAATRRRSRTCRCSRSP